MSEPLYHLARGSQQTGPYPLAQLQAMWAAGQIDAATLYWKEGQANWEPLANMASLLGASPPGATPPPLAPTALPPPFVGAQPATSGMAIASMVLGILGFFTLLTSLPAIILGHLSLSQIRQSGGALAGRGMAITGLVLGYLMVVLFAGLLVIGIVAGIALPVFAATTVLGKTTTDLTQAKQIALAVKLYESDHDERTPPNLDALFPTYLSDRKVLRSPLGTSSGAPGYDLLLPDTDTKTLADESTTVLIRGHYTSADGRRSYVYADLHGETKHDP